MSAENVLRDLLQEPFGPYVDEIILSPHCRHTGSKPLLLENLMLSYQGKPTGCASLNSLTCVISHTVALTTQNFKHHSYHPLLLIYHPFNLAPGLRFGVSCWSWLSHIYQTRVSNTLIVTLRSVS